MITLSTNIIEKELQASEKPTEPNKHIFERVPQKGKEIFPNPNIPEIEPQRPREKPTEPNKHVPESVPQKEMENFPNPNIPEIEPQRTLENLMS
jgi:hypothetical protein